MFASGRLGGLCLLSSYKKNLYNEGPSEKMGFFYAPMVEWFRLSSAKAATLVRIQLGAQQ
jgi:hypothetical protein